MALTNQINKVVESIAVVGDLFVLNLCLFLLLFLWKKALSKQATVDDPRKTRCGDFLRRTNLDELPQFINVFRGEMSIVGPRPHMLAHTETYTQLIDKYIWCGTSLNPE